MEFLDLKTTEIANNALQRLNDFTNITFLSPGSKARMIVDILSEELDLQARQFDKGVGAGLLRKAEGNTLEFIGDIYGIKRQEEVRSSVDAAEQNFQLSTLNGSFGAINNGRDITISPGELVFSNNEDFSGDAIIYSNTETIVLKAAENSAFFAAESLTSGQKANTGINSLVYHKFTNYSDSLNRSLQVTNTNSISYGRDRESDANLRYRIQKEKISSEAGNETAIRMSLLSIPGIAEIVKIPYSRGVGTCDWLISATDINVSGELLAAAQEAVNAIQSVGMSNIAKAPILIGTEFIFSIRYRGTLEDRQKDKIKADIKRNILNYVNNLKIGENLILDQVIKVILNSSDLIESMGDENSSDNFKNIFIYKRSSLSNSLIRKTLTTDYKTQAFERVILENTIASPVTIIDIN